MKLTARESFMFLRAHNELALIAMVERLRRACRLPPRVEVGHWRDVRQMHLDTRGPRDRLARLEEGYSNAYRELCPDPFAAAAYIASVPPSLLATAIRNRIR